MTVSLRCDCAFFLEKLAIIKCCLRLSESVARHSWLYKLTIDKQYYNIGAVIGILTFIILAAAALLTYRNTKSYKEEGGF